MTLLISIYRHTQRTQNTSTPNCLLRNPQIPSNRDHKALNRSTLGGVGNGPFSLHFGMKATVLSTLEVRVGGLGWLSRTVEPEFMRNCKARLETYETGLPAS